MIAAQEQMKIICKGIDTLLQKEELLEKLERSVREEKPLTVKFGMDPSAPDIHLGHTVALRKLRQMQDLGHKVVIIIGDFTGRIGDPTGKSKGRTALSEEIVKKNAQTYCEQIFKVLDTKKTEIRFNSEWLSKLDFEEVIRLAATTTVARMLERDDFQSRYQNRIPIGVHEFFYPLMQAYDSVVINADLELGGTDQTFNILMGRNLQKAYSQEAQAAIFVPLLVGLDGKEKMSKSLGNYVGIDEPAEVMFKKLMEVPDELIVTYFELVTDEHPDRIDDIRRQLKAGANPRDIKLILAETVTGLYHSQDEVEAAKIYYREAFSNKAIPEGIPELPVASGETIYDTVAKLINIGLVTSKSEFLRLVKQGGVQLNGEKLQPEDVQQPLKPQDVMKIGRKRFVKYVTASIDD